MRAVAVFILTAAAGRAAPPLAVAASSAAAVSTAAVEGALPAPGSVDRSKAELDARDPVDALSEAESAVARGGGADAYAARADAKRALGRPMAEVAADYAQAARFDARYEAKYQGLLVQQDSEQTPGLKSKVSGRQVANTANIIAGVLAFVTLSGLALVIGLVMLHTRDTPASPDRPES